MLSKVRNLPKLISRKISTLWTPSPIWNTQKWLFLNKSFFFRQGVTPLAPRVQASIGKCLRDKPTYEAFAHSMTTTSTRMRRRLRSQMLFPVRMRRTRRLCAQCGNNGNSLPYDFFRKFREINFASFLTCITRFHGNLSKWESILLFPHCVSEVEVSEVVVVRDVELEEAFKVVDFERLRPHSGKVLFIKVEKSSWLNSCRLANLKRP